MGRLQVPCLALALAKCSESGGLASADCAKPCRQLASVVETRSLVPGELDLRFAWRQGCSVVLGIELEERRACA